MSVMMLFKAVGISVLVLGGYVFVACLSWALAGLFFPDGIVKDTLAMGIMCVSLMSGVVYRILRDRAAP